MVGAILALAWKLAPKGLSALQWGWQSIQSSQGGEFRLAGSGRDARRQLVALTGQDDTAD
jgi:hypothetical protein